MTAVRVMGTEVEYGVSLPGSPNANAMLLSAQVVNGYASLLPGGRRRRPGWDFEEESPLRDARGFDLSGPSNVAEQFLEDEEDAGLANVVLPNGARLYVDHAHPEYSTPEVTTPLDIVKFDKAGELVMLAASRQAEQLAGATITLYKNNTDNKGVSYGAHENYLMSRQTPFAAIVSQLTPFFVTRQVVCGAGRVGIGQDGHQHGFQISQRADFFEVEVGLETTLKRPIINTRDEPHADAEKYRRLHVILGDANLAELSTFLKVGTTSLVLAMIEDGWLTDEFRIAEPVRELRSVSHDPTLQHLIRLSDGRSLTALDVQREYLDRARKYVDDRVRQRGGPADRAGARRVGLGALPARRGPDVAGRRAGLGGQAAAAGRLPGSGRPGLVGPAAARGGPAVRRHPAGQGPVPPAGAAVARCGRWSAPTTVPRRSIRRRPTPAPTSGVNACAGTRTRWPPRPGTR